MLLGSFRDPFSDKSRQLRVVAFCQAAVVPLDGADGELELPGGFAVAVELGEGEDDGQLALAKAPPLLAFAFRIAVQCGLA